MIVTYFSLLFPFFPGGRFSYPWLSTHTSNLRTVEKYLGESVALSGTRGRRPVVGCALDNINIGLQKPVELRPGRFQPLSLILVP